MFTGLIEEVGRVHQVRRQGDFQYLEIAAAHIHSTLRLGDSVNIDGACQTVVDLKGDTFAVESVAETLARSTLGDLYPGAGVNLERSMRLQDRLDGHLVLGHVDGVALLTRLEKIDEAWLLEVEIPPGLERYIAGKGSVALNGISLTVVEATPQTFTVSVIPHTFEHTTLSQKQSGARVNLEVDIIARYVERMLSSRENPAVGLTLEKMRDMGY